MVMRMGSIKNGVLRITSNEASGLIGFFCGRYITGAVVTLSGEQGHKALVKLLSSRDGTYAFLDAGDEVLPDLAQSLGIDVGQLLAAKDFNEGAVLTEATLTGLVGSADQIRAFDTTVDITPDASEAERLGRITRTYERLLALSFKRRSDSKEFPSVQTSETPVFLNTVPQQEVPSKETADSAPSRERTSVERPRDTIAPPASVKEREKPAIPPWDIPYEPPTKAEASPSTTFSRLKKWSDRQGSLTVLAWVSFLVILALFLYFTLPTILGFQGGHH